MPPQQIVILGDSNQQFLDSGSLASHFGLPVHSGEKDKSNRAYNSQPDWPGARYKERSLDIQVTEVLNKYNHFERKTLLVIQAPLNDLTNLSEMPREKAREFAQKSSFNTFQTASYALRCGDLPLVVVLSRPRRADDAALSELTAYSNNHLATLIEESGLENLVLFEDSSLQEFSKSQLYGRRNFDGIHFRGSHGVIAYTSFVKAGIQKGLSTLAVLEKRKAMTLTRRSIIDFLVRALHSMNENDQRILAHAVLLVDSVIEDPIMFAFQDPRWILLPILVHYCRPGDHGQLMGFARRHSLNVEDLDQMKEVFSERIPFEAIPESSDDWLTIQTSSESMTFKRSCDYIRDVGYYLYAYSSKKDVISKAVIVTARLISRTHKGSMTVSQLLDECLLHLLPLNVKGCLELACELLVLMKATASIGATTKHRGKKHSCTAQAPMFKHSNLSCAHKLCRQALNNEHN